MERGRLYAVEGVVLRRRPTGEADAVVTILSPTHGRFACVARGVRKALSRTRGHLEPLTYGRYLLARGRSLDIVTQAETVRTFSGVERSLVGQAAALYVADLALHLAAEHEPAARLFALLLEVLEALDRGGGLAAVQYFELRAAGEAGYGVQLDACVRCGASIRPEPTFFSPAAGGLLCKGCRADGGPGMMLEVRTMKLLRYGLTAPLRRFLAVRADGLTREQATRALRAWLTYHLERELPSARYLDEVLALEEQAPAGGPMYHS